MLLLRKKMWWRERKFLCVKVVGKIWIFKRFEERHEALRHTREGTSKTEEKPIKNVSPTLQISQYEEIVKECANLCHGESRLPEDIRNMFDSFEFDRQDAVDLWEILEPVIPKFHGDAEKFIVLFMVYCKKIYCPINLVEILP